MLPSIGGREIFGANTYFYSRNNKFVNENLLETLLSVNGFLPGHWTVFTVAGLL
jgi:hypothetical protein